MALKRRCLEIGLLHHSDQGYTCAARTQRVLAGRGIISSLRRRGNCDDYAVMEGFFWTVNSELGERFDIGG